MAARSPTWCACRSSGGEIRGFQDGRALRALVQLIGRVPSARRAYAYREGRHARPSRGARPTRARRRAHVPRARAAGVLFAGEGPAVRRHRAHAGPCHQRARRGQSPRPRRSARARRRHRGALLGRAARPRSRPASSSAGGGAASSGRSSASVPTCRSSASSPASCRSRRTRCSSPRRASWRARRPDVRFLVVGDGERRAALEQLAGELGLGARVSFLGWRGDLDRIYADLDVVALTSRNEGSPVALIEAMAAGRAVVSTRCRRRAGRRHGWRDGPRWCPSTTRRPWLPRRTRSSRMRRSASGWALPREPACWPRYRSGSPRRGCRPTVPTSARRPCGSSDVRGAAGVVPPHDPRRPRRRLRLPRQRRADDGRQARRPSHRCGRDAARRTAGTAPASRCSAAWRSPAPWWPVAAAVPIRDPRHAPAARRRAGPARRRAPSTTCGRSSRRSKLVAQIVVAAALAGLGLQLRLTGYPPLDIVLTLVWIVGDHQRLQPPRQHGRPGRRHRRASPPGSAWRSTSRTAMRKARRSPPPSSARSLGFLVHNFNPALDLHGRRRQPVPRASSSAASAWSEAGRTRAAWSRCCSSRSSCCWCRSSTRRS